MYDLRKQKKKELLNLFLIVKAGLSEWMKSASKSGLN